MTCFPEVISATANKGETMLSIIIVNYNAKSYLENCLESIYANLSAKETTFEVIVVDNNSTDDSIQMVREKFPNVKLIENERNEGFIKANNKGIIASKGEYVLSLNNDTVVLPGALEELTNFMDCHPDAGACGAKVLNSDGSIQHQCKRGFPTISSALSYFLGLHKVFPKSKFFGHYLMTYLDPNQINEVDSLSGACLMVRREVINHVGIMDEDYIMYGDDLDWCYRIKKAGWKIYYVPDARIIHYGGMGGSRALPYRNIWEFHRSMVIFYKKHFSKNRSLFLNWFVYGGIWLKAITNLAINFLRKEKIVGSRKPRATSQPVQFGDCK